MDIEEGLCAFLEAATSVTAVASTRIYPDVLPQVPQYPAVTIERISGQRVHNLAGPSGLGTPRIRINAWALSKAESKSLARAIRQAVDGYRGLMGTVEVRQTRIENEIDLYESDVFVYRTAQDYFLSHAEAP